MSTILALDTASPEIAVALAVDGAVVRSRQRDATMDHTRVLLATIDEVLGAESGALTGIAVVLGPGSYAGLRVGLATAQGLALARNVPIRGMSTMQAVAAACGLADFLAIHPAGRGEFATQRFEHGKPAGQLGPQSRDALAGTLAGEGAGELGGVEVSPEARCHAALAALSGAFATAEPGAIDAVYLREPNITLPRRKVAG